MKIEIEVEDIKDLRESLCIAQTELGQSPRWDQPQRRWAMNDVQKLVDELDKHRPVGADGKHGSKHTATCGCNEETKDNDFWEGVYYE